MLLSLLSVGSGLLYGAQSVVTIPVPEQELSFANVDTLFKNKRLTTEKVQKFLKKIGLDAQRTSNPEEVVTFLNSEKACWLKAEATTSTHKPNMTPIEKENSKAALLLLAHLDIEPGNKKMFSGQAESPYDNKKEEDKSSTLPETVDKPAQKPHSARAKIVRSIGKAIVLAGFAAAAIWYLVSRKKTATIAKKSS